MFKNILRTIFQNSASFLLGFASLALIARILGPEDQGKFALLVVLANLVYQFLCLGTPASTIFFLGGNKIEFDEVFRINTYVSLIASLVGIVISSLVVYFFRDNLFDNIDWIYFVPVLLSIPFLFLKNSLLSVLQGIENFRKYNLVQLFERLLFLLLILIFLYSFQEDLFILVILFFVTQLVTSSLILSYFHAQLPSILKFPTMMNFKDVMKFGIKVHLSNIIGFLLYRVDYFIVSYLLGSFSVGLYSIAVSLAEKLWILSGSISTVFYARIVNMSKVVDKTNLTREVTTVTFYLTLFLTLIIALFSSFLILGIFGKAYELSITPFLILLPGIVLTAAARIISNYFSGIGNPELNGLIALIMLIINVVLNFILIPKFGINGAALATSIAYGFQMIVNFYWFSRTNHLSFFSLLSIKTFIRQITLLVIRKN